MNLTLALYLTDVLISINNIFGFIFIIFMVFTITLSIAFMATRDNYSQEENDIPLSLFKEIYKKLWVIILCIIPILLIPSKTTMYLMLGSSYLSQTNIPSQVSETLNLKLTDIIEELKNKDKKSS